MTTLPKTTEVISYIAILVLYIQSIRLSKLYIYKDDLISFVIYSLSYIVTGLVVILMFVFINDTSLFYELTIVYVVGIFIRMLGKFIHAKKIKDEKTYNEVVETLNKLKNFIILTLILIILCAIIFDLIYWLTGGDNLYK